jgi:peroxiredoxin
MQVLRLGNVIPDFSAQTTQGDMPSFHEWIDGSWAILFSHPADFTVRRDLTASFMLSQPSACTQAWVSMGHFAWPHRNSNSEPGAAS